MIITAIIVALSACSVAFVVGSFMAEEKWIKRIADEVRSRDHRINLLEHENAVLKGQLKR